MPAPDKLTERQLAICLLLSHGISQKRIATLLDIGLRTVELEKRHVAAALRSTTNAVSLWSVEHREWISESTSKSSLLTPAVLEEIRKSRI
jgi:DNA-binding NarL/FixJ family response regulator